MVKLAAEQCALVERWMPLARSIAVSEHRRLHREFDDAYGDAMVGLCQAVVRYDPTRGYSFSSYATPVIQGAIRRSARDQSDLPRPTYERGTRLGRAAGLFAQHTGRQPNAAELADLTDRPEAEVERDLLVYARRPKWSLDIASSNEDSETLLSVKSEADTAAEGLAAIDREALWAAIRLLEPRRRTMIVLMVAGQSQAEVARRLGVTQMTISRWYRQALTPLRAALTGGDMETGTMARPAQQVLKAALQELEARIAKLEPFEAELKGTRDAAKAVDAALRKLAQRSNRSTVAGAAPGPVRNGLSPRAKFKERVRGALSEGPMNIDQLQEAVGCASQDYLLLITRALCETGDLEYRDNNGHLPQYVLTELGSPEPQPQAA